MKPDLRHASRRYEILPNRYFYRYQPPTPAKELLAELWRLEKEAEKMLEGLVQ
jgi:type I restriction enzyme M protein